jgi:hypothetical protein
MHFQHFAGSRGGCENRISRDGRRTQGRHSFSNRGMLPSLAHEYTAPKPRGKRFAEFAVEGASAKLEYSQSEG